MMSCVASQVITRLLVVSASAVGVTIRPARKQMPAVPWTWNVQPNLKSLVGIGP